MNSAEITEAIMAQLNTGLTTTALYLSVVSGYLVVGYTVGKQLTRFQLAVVSLLFMLFSFWLAYGGFSVFINANEFIARHGDGIYSASAAAAYIIFGLEILGIVAALAFMLHSRHKNS